MHLHPITPTDDDLAALHALDEIEAHGLDHQTEPADLDAMDELALELVPWIECRDCGDFVLESGAVGRRCPRCADDRRVLYRAEASRFAERVRRDRYYERPGDRIAA